MAITGSTRMQATTAELFIVASALEIAMVRFLQQKLSPSDTEKFRLREYRPDEYHKRLCVLLDQLSSDEVVDMLAAATVFEEDIYRRHGLVTYFADKFLLDVLTDTTERSPTFMLPAFRKKDDNLSSRSWAFVKDPFRSTKDAWRELLQHESRGLDWGRDVYEKMNAPDNLKIQPPKLDNAEIHKFMIGNEFDTSRTDAVDSALIVVGVGNEDKVIHTTLEKFGSQYKKTAVIIVGPADAVGATDKSFHFPCTLADSPLQLWHHLAIKIVLNTLSTATMVRMDRVIGNAMVWLSPSNKKLIDRGCRLIAQQMHCSYEQACITLHEALEEVELLQQQGKEVPSPVALAIERIKQDNPSPSR
jgi:N-acetylmuramic acid 6-phosphate etherase